jgi:hypothetical protein
VIGCILLDKNHLYITMLFILQGCCFIQSLHFIDKLQEDSVQNSQQYNSFPLHPSRRRGIQSGCSSVKASFVQTFLCVQKLRNDPGCIISTTRPNAFNCLTRKRISFQNTNMGRQLQPARRCVFPSERYP